MKHSICSLVALIVLMTGSTAFAGESLDVTLDFIEREYFRQLTAEERSDMQLIVGGAGGDNEKIEQVCALLDPHTTYSRLGPHTSHPGGEPPYEAAAGAALYIKIRSFSFGVDDSVTALLNEYPALPLLLDLSECGGGVLAVMENIARCLVPSGPIYTGEYRERTEIRASELASGRPAVFVCVTGETASCAEILAAALQDAGAATLVGGRTYGKGSIQRMCALPNGGLLTLTVGRWTTRGGVDVEGRGLEPDIPMDESEIATLVAALLWIIKGGF